MARKDKADQAASVEPTDAAERAGDIAAEGDALEAHGAEMTLIDALSVEINKARAASDHAATGALETLHMQAGEFLMRLRAAEGWSSGDVLAAVQRLRDSL